MHIVDPLQLRRLPRCSRRSVTAAPHSPVSRRPSSEGEGGREAGREGGRWGRGGREEREADSGSPMPALPPVTITFLPCSWPQSSSERGGDGGHLNRVLWYDGNHSDSSGGWLACERQLISRGGGGGGVDSVQLINPAWSNRQFSRSSHHPSQSRRATAPVDPSGRAIHQSGAANLAEPIRHSQREFGAIRAVHSHLPRFPRYLPQQVQWAG